MPLITPDQTDGQPPSESLDRQAPVQRYDAPPTGSASVAEPIDGPPPRQRWVGRHRRSLIATAALAVLALAIFATIARGAQSDDDSVDAVSDTEAIRAVEATTGDLAEFLTVDGTLDFEAPTSLNSAADGTITALAAEGEILQRGEVAYSLNAAPVVVFWGDFPLYRPLADGVEDGEDVAVLEANLVALGYGADGELVVDQSFDEHTTAAIEEFQDDLDWPIDGAINSASVVVLEGPAIVSDVMVEVGEAVRIGAPILSLQITDVVTMIALPGDELIPNEGVLITAVPSVGDRFETGDMAYEIDTDPVVVIIGDSDFDRILAMGSSDGSDVELLEQTLQTLGYDAGGDLVVDEHFDEATESALMSWEEELGLGGDGVATLREFVVLPPDHEVIAVVVERGDRLDPDANVFTVGVSNRTLSATVEDSDRDLISIGDRVEVDIAGATVIGTIVAIADVSANPADPAIEPGVNIEISVDDAIEADDIAAVDVEVRITQSLVSNAVLVPASALISVGDGSYAVEVVRGDATAFVAVEPGMFADGMVQVDGIDAGTAVVVPR